MTLRSSFAEDDSMADLLSAYVQALALHLRALRNHIAHNDADAARALLHQLKGSGKSYGFAPITQHAAAAEAALAAGDPLSAALPHIDNLIHSVESIEGYRP